MQKYKRECTPRGLPWFLVAHCKVGSKQPKKCWTMQANTWVCRNKKANNGKHDTFAPTYKENEKCVLFHKQCGAWVWSCLDNLKHCASGSITRMGFKLANSPQHVAGEEDLHRSLERGGVGNLKCHVPIELEGTFLPCPWNIMYPS